MYYMGLDQLDLFKTGLHRVYLNTLFSCHSAYVILTHSHAHPLNLLYFNLKNSKGPRMQHVLLMKNNDITAYFLCL